VSSRLQALTLTLSALPALCRLSFFFQYPFISLSPCLRCFAPCLILYQATRHNDVRADNRHRLLKTAHYEHKRKEAGARRRKAEEQRNVRHQRERNTYSK